MAARELASPGSLQLEVLRKYLEIKGVDLNERDQMIDTLLDWVAPNTGLHRLNATPETGNYHPSHTLLKQIDELKKIKGWEEFTSAKDWDADLTLDSKAEIDIQWASRDILLALPGASEDRVDQFLALRSGADAINGTEDDPPIAEALVALGIPQLHSTGLITVGVPDHVMRVVSVGKSGDVVRTVRAVFVKGSNQLKSWKEF